MSFSWTTPCSTSSALPGTSSSGRGCKTWPTRNISADCWSVRPGNEGHWRQDLADREPDPPPFTTIAWRLAHIATVFGERASNHFGNGSFDPAQVAWTGSTDDALDIVTAEYTRWREGVRSLGEEGFFLPCGPAEGPYADEPFLMLVLHINHEFLHHAAEVMLLRDLYRDAGA